MPSYNHSYDIYAGQGISLSKSSKHKPHSNNAGEEVFISNYIKKPPLYINNNLQTGNSKKP